MQKFKTWWYAFQKSCLSSKYYAHVLKARFSFSLLYLAVLLLIVSFVQAIVFLTPVLIINVGLISSLPTTLRSELETFYPSDLVVTIEDGRLRTNVEEPYIINVPSLENETFPNFLTIDTTASIEDFPQYNTAILVTETAIAYTEEYGSPNGDDESASYTLDPTAYQYSVQSLAQVENVTLTREGYDQILTQLTPYLKYIPVFIIVFSLVLILVVPFFLASFSLLWQLFYLGFMSLVLWVIAKILGKQLKLGQLYQLGIHGLTLPIVITTVVSFFGLNYPFLFSLIFLVWMCFVLTQWPKKIAKTTTVKTVTTKKKR